MTVATPPRAPEPQWQQPQRPAKSPTKRRFGRDRTTPGVLSVLMVVVLVSSIVIGAIAALSLQSRQAALDKLATTDSQVAAAALEFEQALGAADIAASGGFVARSQNMNAERTQYENRYQQAINEAQSALATLVTRLGANTDTEQRDLVSSLPAKLSEYTKLVEDARSFSRLNNPVAAVYQLIAADTMHSILLPEAANLRTSAESTVAADADIGTDVPYLELSLAVLLLLILVAVQIYLRKKTRRVFNIGLLAASVATVAMIGWIAYTTLNTADAVERSDEEGAQVIQALTTARNTATVNRSNESLIAVATQENQGHASYINDIRGRVWLFNVLRGGQLDLAKRSTSDPTVQQHLDTAMSAAEVWTNPGTRREFREGAGAVGKAIEVGGSGDGEKKFMADRLLNHKSAAAYYEVDEALDAAIDETSLQYEEMTSEASSGMTGVVIGVLVLALLTALGATSGVWQRLREYR